MDFSFNILLNLYRIFSKNISLEQVLLLEVIS